MITTPPVMVLLCLDPSHHGQFYLPLDEDARSICPEDSSHPVAVYSLLYKDFHRAELKEAAA